MDKSIQSRFFNSIRQQLPAYISVVHEVAESLGISYDSAYRRMRGDKELSIEEIKILSSRFRISVDSLFGLNDEDVLFQPFDLGSRDDGLELLLKLMTDEIEKMEHSAEAELILVTRDLPLFYYFDFPELATFKLFFWKKLIYHLPLYHDSQFVMDYISPELMSAGNYLLDIYNKISTVEIWCQETFTRFMQQIEFCLVSGFFHDKHDAMILFDKLETLIRHIQYQTEQGKKFRPGTLNTAGRNENFRVFINEVLIIDNTGFVRADGLRRAFIASNSANVILTTHPKFCNQVEQALHLIMKTGMLISGTSALECNRFFNLLYEKLEEYREKTMLHRTYIQK